MYSIRQKKKQAGAQNTHNWHENAIELSMLDAFVPRLNCASNFSYLFYINLL